MIGTVFRSVILYSSSTTGRVENKCLDLIKIINIFMKEQILKDELLSIHKRCEFHSSFSIDPKS